MGKPFWPNEYEMYIQKFGHVNGPYRYDRWTEIVDELWWEGDWWLWDFIRRLQKSGVIT